MRSIKNVYLIGLGAIGGAFAGRIQERCPGCLKIIVDDERYTRYTKDGIHINNQTYCFDFVRPYENGTTADLLMVAVKQNHLAQAIRDMAGFVGAGTIILPLLNGISSEEIIGREYGMEKVLYAFCVGTDTVREGTSVSYGSIGRIVFGDRNNKTLSPNVEAVRDFFDMAGIPYAIPEDMLKEQWWKFMMNVGINQVSAVLRAPYGVFQGAGEARDLMISASREVIEISRRIGVNLDERDIDKYMTILAGLSPQGKTSMLQDVEARRKTEVEIFAGTVMQLGKKLGVSTPVNDVLYRMIRAIEQLY